MHTQPATRRSVLAGGVSVAAALPLAASAAHAMPAGGLPAKVRAEALRTYAALLEVGTAETRFGGGSPEHRAAEAQYQALHDRFERLSAAVWSAPAKNFDDLLARAEIVNFGCDRSTDGAVTHFTSDDCFERPAAELMRAVLEMAGVADAIAPLEIAHAKTREATNV